ncbi:hypothetical protein ACLK1U_18980 [Escherichia coli]
MNAQAEAAVYWSGSTRLQNGAGRRCDHILGSENAFEGADLSAKLKLLGVDVGGIGDAHGRTPGARSYVYLDESKEIYKRLIVSENDKTLLGAVLVGDTSDYGNLLQLVLNAIELPENPGF